MTTAENTALLQEFLGQDAEAVSAPPRKSNEPALTGTIDVDRGLTQLERRLTGVDKGPVVTIRRPTEGPGSGIATAGEAFAEGAIQGGTFGFGEELTALARSQRVGRTKAGAPVYDYKATRELERARLKKVQEEQPGFYTAGEIGGGVLTAAVPGLGVARGAKFGTMLGQSAAAGGIVGAGKSEKEGLAALSDVAAGAATGVVAAGALAGAGKALGAVGKLAKGRIEKQGPKLLLEKVPASEQDKALARFGGSREGLGKFLRQEGVAGKTEREILEVATDKSAKAGQELGAAYQAAEDLTPMGIPVTKAWAKASGRETSIESALEDLATKYAKRGNTKAAKMIQGEARNLKNTWGDGAQVTEVHDRASDLGKFGFGGNFFAPSESRQIGREMSRVLRDHLDDAVGEAAGKTGATKDALANLKDANKRYAQWQAIEDLAESKVKRLERVAPSMGERIQEGVRSMTDISAIGGAAGAALTGNLAPLALTALPAAARLIPRAGPLVTRGAARAGAAGERFAAGRAPGLTGRLLPQAQLQTATAAEADGGATPIDEEAPIDNTELLKQFLGQ